MSESDVAKEENPDGKKNLSDALTEDRFSQPQREEILAFSKGYEQNIFDHFFKTKRQILQYIKWLSESDVAKEENPDGKNKLSDALTKDRFSQPQREEILAFSEGYEQDILDHFFNEAIVSEPAPCGKDTLVMFASAPGTL